MTPDPSGAAEADHDISVEAFTAAEAERLERFRRHWIAQRAADQATHPRKRTISDWIASYRAFQAIDLKA